MRTFFTLTLSALLSISSSAQEAPPAKALKYHEALLKRPDNTTLFDRFFGAWLDEQPIEALDAFLAGRAEKNGGQNLAILARHQLRRGREDDALGTLGRAITALPEEFSLPLERAKILLRRLEFAEARKDLAVVAGSPNEALSLEAAKLSGKSWLREGKPEEALKAWDALLAAHPGDEELLEDLVESAASEGQAEQAIAYLDKLIAKSADPYSRTLRQLRRAELLARAGKSDDAALAFSAALANVGEGSWLEREILAQFEKLFRSQDRVADLKAELRKLVEANPRRLLVHRQLAKLEAADGETDAAIGRFREVLRRSPGEAELREEFIKLLIDSKRYDDAAAELEKMIALAPENAELHLRMAALFAEQEKTEATLASLEKAHALLGDDEVSGLRIASLMLGYGMGKEGEALLGKLLAAANASLAPAEALATEFVRTNRSKDAVALLERAAANAELEAVIRITGSISRLGESEKAYDLLKARLADFPTDPRFLAAISQASIAAAKPAEAVAPAMKLIRLAEQESEIRDAVSLASRAIAAADESGKWRETLGKQETRSLAETCLFATLTEAAKDFPGVAKLLAESTDPLLIRFHASLLERRGDFVAALAALEALAATEEGRKASFFKALSELQIRAFKIEEALKTLDAWKLSAPGDRTPWLIAGRLLRDSGRAAQAISMTRSALARFGDDEDLAATLASLHEAVGAYADAEEIYWRLYDSSPDPVSQSRWAAQLSLLAQRTSTTTVLQEKFEERARNNRRSLGPILAQVELARVMRDDVARRELLQQALRLQPQKADIRIQLADIEEKAGNAEAANALLREGLDADKTGRLRSALAQAYIRQGEVLKGTHMLRAISSNGGSDPRLIESLTATILTAGMPEEAARFLTEALPDGGDWRTRYLLASILEEDGREDEALPIFIALQEAEGDLPGIAANQGQGISSGCGMSMQQSYSHSGANRISSLIQANYRIYQDGRGNTWSGSGRGGATQLPSSVEEVRLLSFVRLAKLASDGGAETEALIRHAGVKGIAFAKDLIASAPRGFGGADYMALLEKYPNEPGLFQMVFQSGSFGRENGPDPRREAFLRKFLESEELEPLARLQVAAVLLGTEGKDEAAWDAFVSAAEKCAESVDVNTLTQAGSQIYNMVATQDQNIPGKHADTLFRILLRISENEKCDPNKGEEFRLNALAMMGKAREWIAAMNAMVAPFREKQSEALKAQLQNQRYNPWQYGISEFLLPDIDRFRLSSLPTAYTRVIRYKDLKATFPGSIDAEALLEHLGEFESPAMRAYVAIKAGENGKALEILSTVPPEAEAFDFQLLKAVIAIEKKDFLLAYECFRESKSVHPYMEAMRDFSLLAIAKKMTAEQRKAVGESLHDILSNAAKQASQESAGVLAGAAKELGFEDLEKAFTAKLAPANAPSPPTRQPVSPGTAKPPGPAVFAARSIPRTSSQPQQQLSLLDRMQKFAADGKTDAASRELLLYLRSFSRNGQFSEYTVREAMKASTEEVREGLLSLIDPGESRSLTRRLFYIDVCMAMGKIPEAVAELGELVTERPQDAALTIRLAFILPPEESTRALSLLTRAAAAQDFERHASQVSTLHLEYSESARPLAYMETLTAWLEKSKPADLRGANLSWISYQSQSLFRGQFRLPCLLVPLRENTQEPELNQRTTNLGRRLATAMMRHPALAEEGFRLNLASMAWADKAEQLDEAARRVLLIAEVPEQGQQARNWFNLYVGGRNSGSSGGELEEFSSMGWLAGRLDTMKMAEIFPPPYLADLRRENPQVGAFVTAFAGMDGADSLAEAWESEAMAASDPFSAMLTSAIVERASRIPGASGYFLRKIKEFKPGSLVTNINNTGKQGEDARLARSGFRIAAGRGGKELETMCLAIIGALLDGKPDWSPEADYHKLYAVSNALNALMGDLEIPLESIVETLHILNRQEVPFSTGEPWLNRNLQKARVTDAEQGIELLESMGMLADTKDWKPIVILLQATTREGDKNLVVRETKTLNVSSNNLPLGISSKDFAEALKSHKPRTFGSLITAASFSQDSERGELTAAAFALAAPLLGKFPDERLEDFYGLVAWLPKESIATLPDFFRKKAQQEHEKNLAEVLRKAEEVRKSYGANPSHFFTYTSKLITRIAELDQGKAVAFFLEAERAYTAGLAQGGTLSSNSPEMMLTDRDSHLAQILGSLSSRNNGDAELALSFLNAVATSPEAGRFSFGANGMPLLGYVGQSLSKTASLAMPRNPSQWLGLTEAALAQPAELQELALAAASCVAIGQSQIRDLNSEATLAKSTGKSERYRALASGTLSFPSDKPEQRAATSKIISELLADGEVTETTRMQLAFTMAARIPAVLADPAIAEAIADLFTAYCAEERSAVNNLAISVVAAISQTEVSDSNLPHLKRIQDAFWENADSPKTGGHPAINPTSAKPLFLTALATGEDKITDRLFLALQPSLKGDFEMILKLITRDYFALAAKLLPEEGDAEFQSRVPGVYTKELDGKLTAFRETDVDPTALLRFETALLAMAVRNHEPSATGRIARLVATYRKHPPENAQTKLRLLSALGTSTDPASDLLSAELMEMAESLDPMKTLNGWANPPNNHRKTLASAEWEILCKAAANRLLAGDAAHFASLLAAVPKVSRPSDNYYSAASLAQQRILSFILPSICAAISEGKTGTFPELIEPLGSLAVALSKPQSHNREQIIATMAVCELLAHWTGKPEAFSAFFEQIDGKSNPKLENIFSFPRYSPPFLDALELYDRGNHLSVLGPLPEGFPLAFFSHPSISDLIPADSNEWPDELARSNLGKSVAKLALEEFPETITPAGRTVLLLHRAKLLWNSGRRDEVPAAFRACLAEMPPGKPWDNIRTFAKCQFANEIFRKGYESEEARKLLESINPEEVSRSHKSFYESLLKRLKKAETSAD